MKDRLHRPVLSDASDIGTNSFVANWEEVDGAIAYRLHIDEQLPDSLNPVILSEDFSALTDGSYPKSGTEEIGQSLDSYLTSGTWYGSQIYSCGGYLRMGGYGQSGTLYTPVFDASNSGGQVTLSLDAKSYPAKNVAFTVQFGDVYSNTVIDSRKFKANKTEQNYNLTFTEGTQKCRFIISTDNERLFINCMCVVKGEVDSAEIWTLGPKSWAIDSIQKNHCLVKGLVANRTYKYNVMALAAEALNSSLVSASKYVTTANENTDIVTIPTEAQVQLLSTIYYDMTGRRVDAATKGLIVWRKVYSDGTILTGKSVK